VVGRFAAKTGAGAAVEVVGADSEVTVEGDDGSFPVFVVAGAGASALGGSSKSAAIDLRAGFDGCAGAAVVEGFVVVAPVSSDQSTVYSSVGR